MKKILLPLVLLLTGIASGQITQANVFQFRFQPAAQHNPPANSAYLYVFNNSLQCLLPSGASCLAGGGSGTVTNIATTAPLGGGPITTTGTLTCTTCATTTNGGALTATNPMRISAAGVIDILGTGQVAASVMPALTGDVTSSAGTVATTVGQISGAAIPTSAFFVGTNSSKQLIAAQPFVTNAQTTTYQAVAADFTGCKTITVASGTFTVTLVASGTQPASGQCINVVNYGSGVVTIARSGQNINGAAANLTLNAGSASAPTSVTITSDGTNYFASVDEGTVGTVTSVATTSPITGGTITGSGTLACATCVTSAAALTSNAVVLGGGGQAAATNTAFTTNGTTTLTVGVAAGGNGILALAGNTSGTATLTAPAVAGTAGNPVLASNALQLPDGTQALPASRLTTSATGWWYGSSVPAHIFGTTTTDHIGFKTNGTQLGMNSTGALTFGSSSTSLNAANMNADTAISRLAAGILAVGVSATSGSKTGLLQSGMSVFVTANFTTSGVGTALEAITGLTITVPAVAANWTFHAHLAYSQAVGTAAVAFGIQAVTNNPTNCFATGEMFTAAGTVITGTLATLTTTTATNVVSGTPGATATNNVVDLYGTCELAASANTIRILTSTATAADTVTILRGSYFGFNP